MAIAMNFNYGNGNIHCMTTPGKRIRDLRKSKEPAISQSDLAALIGVDQSTISDIENGRGLSAENMMRICEALSTTPQYIMRGEVGLVDIPQQIKSQINALIATLQASPVNVDRVGKPEHKVIPELSSKGHNDQTEPKFGPVLTKFFNSGRGKNNGRSNDDAAASKGTAPTKKRSGGRS